MSDYRYDTTDTATASDSTFVGLRSIIENFALARDTVFFGIAIALSSTAIASDEVIDSSNYMLSSTAIASDEVIGNLFARQSLYDTVKAGDDISYGLLVNHEDTAIASDALLAGTIGTLITDAAIALDSTTEQRTVRVLATDTAQANDWLTSISLEVIEDTAIASDETSGRLNAVSLITDTAIASNELLGNITSFITDSAAASDKVIGNRFVSITVGDTSTVEDTLFFNKQEFIADTIIGSDSASGNLKAAVLISDTAVISDEVIGNIIQSNAITDIAIASDTVISKLQATTSWQDIVVVQDNIINIGGYRGQAWTANVDSWAMSRYNPYNYKRIVVINDVLYGEADDGIYRLDQEVMPVVASVKTGKIDVGRGAITHPAAAYLEYELVGQASMTVHTTQKGFEQQYTYVLPNELADELTNGRFIFGRGLRGRHFSFELTMIGTHGYINDLSVDHQPTSRRV
ncbi:hypothetical protein [Pseudoalteromonas phage vB_PalP_Y7]|nr:hypothetical protein [Pseudoalteromonas phage vB_PalP_Y7]